MRKLPVLFVAGVQLTLLPTVANTARIAGDLEWLVWAKHIDSGFDVIAPTSPGAWFVETMHMDQKQPSQSGWIGRSLKQIGARIDPTICRGEMSFVERAVVQNIFEKIGEPSAVNKPRSLWFAQGFASGQDANAVEHVLLVDQSETAVAFGFTGFRDASNTETMPPTSAWYSYFSSHPQTLLRAYAVLQNGSILCPLNGNSYVPSGASKLVSGQFVEPVQILLGADITQRFRPEALVAGITVQLVAWGRRASPYTISWSIYASDRDGRMKIGSGSFNASEMVDWQVLRMPVSATPTLPDAIEVVFSTADDAPRYPLGIPLFAASTDGHVPPASVQGRNTATNGRVGLTVHYAR